ncbi:MAG: glutamine--scyllo-inositol aminotransferase [Cupriavidus sp.]|uniref:DegT/DnrJ/EryC1/StrS family aminotransferase n=1 Tax=Cupriavidus pauculus TaxID=82633 RepID=UPI000C6BBD67|nr:DegT/DnrJ/EryC1/StrS aminotransferase family protein [Cupriavidus pauculus]KAB0595058.1 DegT/DnrJ/EryC1/StrS aminotransferase family protein [Cupriavidus pauculus]MBU68826.1 glutamine--scyllo-inositol aminotransferase [Cupriavidus sp.]MCM3606462.1 DegT/DnrJ/EryC1/StrS aminotransferase family protein [Cupriavidus pauculus]UAL00554.1 DegT/DnrJ/EryC1/StrS aminotransferase family protein [Cupriavidus pauculus]
MSRIYYTKPSITELEVRYATDAAANGWGEHCYDYIHKFEQGFAEHLGVKHAIATSSCTGAMHLGLAALGIGAGDEVILADINWIATASPIVHLGATPVLVDILPDTWCLDPRKVEAAITPRTRAIIATHIYGSLCDMDALMAIGQRHGIPVIEDAAEALGSAYGGKRAGAIGTFGTFSFHGTKTLTTGEGGMFVTNDPALYERVLTLNNHGRARGETRQFWSERVGFKYKMSNIQAAIGCAQLERIDELVDKKRAIFQWYKEALAPLAAVAKMNVEHAGTVNGYWMPTLVFDQHAGFDREAVLKRFKDENIDGRVFFWPLSVLGVDGIPTDVDTPVAHDISPRSINLPSYHDMGPAEVERVANVLLSFHEA